MSAGVVVEFVVVFAVGVVELESPVPVAVEVCDAAAGVEPVVAGAVVSESAGAGSVELAAG